MKRSSSMLLAAVCVALLICCAGSVLATVITFDDVQVAPYQLQPIPGDWYKNLGVMLSTTGPDGQIYLDNEGAYLNTPPNLCLAGNKYGFFTPLIVDFVVPNTDTPGATNIVGFYLADADTGQGQLWSAAIYDINGNMLDSTSGTTNDEILISFFRADPDIHRLVFTSSTDAEGIDTLSYCDIHPVPEPASLSVLGLGALGLILRKKR